MFIPALSTDLHAACLTQGTWPLCFPILAAYCMSYEVSPRIVSKSLANASSLVCKSSSSCAQVKSNLSVCWPLTFYDDSCKHSCCDTCSSTDSCASSPPHSASRSGPRSVHSPAAQRARRPRLRTRGRPPWHAALAGASAAAGAAQLGRSAKPASSGVHLARRAGGRRSSRSARMRAREYRAEK